ncbi:hypothetical protein CYLTODRAFT_454512 [Cylindrobasidium torrendii FP15055 ss-10]|uniref:Cupredoxin n=1 Tax=Cylindrobasidium torrendii FP15055 ss-10 TaxID=1314674 RepID=A0A0D7BB58_9AGAR|nr:hypothetical protein CYLTODRAFT_454512 [Cylindrobasidium torrendii FP15055 ss-10]
MGLFIFPLVQATVYTVSVGKDETTGKKGVGFDPSVITPQAGDTVTFLFQAGSHSVVASSFERPCTPSGVYTSGVFTVSPDTPVDADGLPTATYTVESSSPLWFFDQAGGECHDGGVLALNPATYGTQTAAAFKANAARDPGTQNAPSTDDVGSNSADGAESAKDKKVDTKESVTDDMAADSATLVGVRIGLMMGAFIVFLGGGIWP